MRVLDSSNFLLYQTLVQRQNGMLLILGSHQQSSSGHIADFLVDILFRAVTRKVSMPAGSVFRTYTPKLYFSCLMAQINETLYYLTRKSIYFRDKYKYRTLVILEPILENRLQYISGSNTKLHPNASDPRVHFWKSSPLEINFTTFRKLTRIYLLVIGWRLGTLVCLVGGPGS